MAKEGYMSGSDAAYMKPKFVPDDELRPRDNSGGVDWEPYSATFGDGGMVTGSKSHLAVSGEDDTDGLNEERGQGRRGIRKDAAYGEVDDHLSAKATDGQKSRTEQRANRKNSGEKVKGD